MDYYDIEDYLLNILESTLNVINILKENNQLEEADKLSSETENYICPYVREIIGYEDIENLLEIFKDLTEINSENPQYWQLKGYSLKDLEESLECYNKAIELDPNNKDYWENKGDCLQELERYEKAIECYDKAIELDPKYTYYWKDKAKC